tara:strand:+ start:668 stop:1342 length:675 start_codon:yes stop_codon:yes gene_type:complete
MPSLDLTRGKIKIAPSVLASNFENLKDELLLVEKSGADWLHLDIMDGHFVPNISFGPQFVHTSRKCCPNIVLDVHLMISHPEMMIKEFIDAGADIITFHIEAISDFQETVKMIKSKDVLVGISLNPETPFSAINSILDQVDIVLLMSVNPGFGGQSFIPSSLEKIKQIHSYIEEENLNVLLEVDGGVNIYNAEEIRKSGADVLVAGTAIFGSNDYAKTISLLRG